MCKTAQHCGYHSPQRLLSLADASPPPLSDDDHNDDDDDDVWLPHSEHFF